MLVPNRSRVRKVTNAVRVIARAPSSVVMLTTLDEDMGHYRSRSTGAPVTRSGDPVPWYTYPAIEYLQQLDFRDRRVFEWGSGNSSLFWAGVARHVTSVEDDAKWFDRVSSGNRPNQTLRLVTDAQEYVDALAAEGQQFDVIVVDGSHRYACAQVAALHLAPGGLIIFDNADWFPKSTSALRAANLLQVDMTGFGPVNKYVWTTSLFFDRAFNDQSIVDRRPRHGVGALVKTLDES
jgi:hypothetical protein